MFRRRVARSEHDADAWAGLLRAARATGSSEVLREAYVDAIKQYPSAGALLAAFVELELSRGNKESAEAVYNNNLFSVRSIELWRSYLDYVLRANVGAAGSGLSPESRATVMDCYKLVLEHVGCDREAGQIWLDYIGFVASAQTQMSYEEQQKTDLLRETYQRAVAIPLLRVEEIWKGYDAFEARTDRAGAKKTLSKISPAYMTARTALREMNRLWAAIRASRPPSGLPAPPEWTGREIEHLGAWKRYLEWEASNPLRLGDAADVRQRVVYAYEQACMALRFYPEIWIEFSEYYSSVDLPAEALERLRMASAVLPSSLAVQFAYAEKAEMLKQQAVCKEVYENTVRMLRQGIDAASAKYARKLAALERRLEPPPPPPPAEGSAGNGAKGGDAAKDAAEDEAPPDSDSDDDDDDYDGEGGSDYAAYPGGDESDASMGSDSDGGGGAAAAKDPDVRRAERQAARARKAVERRMARIRARREDDLKGRREAYSLAWIMYLRHAQRTEGIDSVRQLLRRPRSEPAGYLTYHLYVAAALTEYHVAKRADVAGKLFEYYAKAFPDSPEYITEYMSYLISSGNGTNVRALFERFHGTSIADTTDIWSMFADFEYNYGDMGAIANLDKRFIDRFKHESVLTRMATRYSYLSADCVAVNEFGLPYRPDLHPAADAGDARDSRDARDERGGAPDHAARPRSDSAATAGAMPNIALASITGRHLGKAQLLAPVTPGRFVKPVLGGLQPHRPAVEPLPEPDAPVSAASDAGFRSGPPQQQQQQQQHHRHHQQPPRPGPEPSGPSSRQLLDHGDVLSYVAASVAAPDASAFNGFPLNTDALLATVMQLPGVRPATQSNYRPLLYMPWLARGGDHHAHGGGGGGGGQHRRGDRGPGRPFGGARSRSRGRRDSDGFGGHAARHPARGGFAHRQPPYARSPGRFDHGFRGGA
ncbi:mRNA 3'-end-processing protein rna14 [Coemansia javaensis]|uniref:mRNA 3'-end-processing protein rna14 n=1 Tax=Coemansia javaensis TaxID=2761396 RepID=A0A9W8LI96_9FUNG|nr:mRNA 3'-end-processing protein rna14 [Coemansia javaensis]